jgi:hypothetical protein
MTPTTNESLDLPTRSGDRPTTGPEIPHEQLDQTAPVELQEGLWRRMLADRTKDRGKPAYCTGSPTDPAIG